MQGAAEEEARRPKIAEAHGGVGQLSACAKALTCMEKEKSFAVTPRTNEQTNDGQLQGVGGSGGSPSARPEGAEGRVRLILRNLQKSEEI